MPSRSLFCIDALERTSLSKSVLHSLGHTYKLAKVAIYVHIDVYIYSDIYIESDLHSLL
eukprot:jgi/Botrbrau1/16080/Bobra.7_2s0051.1